MKQQVKMEKPINLKPQTKTHKVEIKIPDHVHGQMQDMSEAISLSYSDCCGMLFSEGLDLWSQSSWDQRKQYLRKYMKDVSVGKVLDLEK